MMSNAEIICVYSQSVSVTNFELCLFSIVAPFNYVISHFSCPEYRSKRVRVSA